MAAMELFVAVMENGASTLAILASNTFVKSCRKVISKCNFHMINLYHFIFVVYSVTTFLFQHSGTGIKTSTESSSNGAATTQGNGILVISSK